MRKESRLTPSQWVAKEMATLGLCARMLLGVEFSESVIS